MSPSGAVPMQRGPTCRSVVPSRRREWMSGSIIGESSQMPGPKGVRYEHTQAGIVIIASVGTAAVLAAVAAAVTREPGPAIVALLLLVVLSQTAAMTTRVADGMLEVRMGVGLIGRRIALRDVARVDVVRNSWIWGWGIRWTPRG